MHFWLSRTGKTTTQVFPKANETKFGFLAFYVLFVLFKVPPIKTILFDSLFCSRGGAERKHQDVEREEGRKQRKGAILASSCGILTSLARKVLVIFYLVELRHGSTDDTDHFVQSDRRE